MLKIKIKLICLVLLCLLLLNSAFANCESEKQARDSLKGTQNTYDQASGWAMLGGAAGGALLGGPIGFAGGLLGLVPGVFGASNNSELEKAEARLSECLGALARA